MLLWAKHPVAIVVAGLLSLLLVVMVKRLIFPARPKVVMRRAPAVPQRSRGGTR
jgi:hypothetical protein